MVDPTANGRDTLAATWYTDSSMIGGRCTALRAMGFAIVVVARSGELLGYGFGEPPSRIATAAAAQLWAIQTVLALCPCTPQIKADCLPILTTAAVGTAQATLYKNIWHGYGKPTQAFWVMTWGRAPTAGSFSGSPST